MIVFLFSYWTTAHAYPARLYVWVTLIKRQIRWDHSICNVFIFGTSFTIQIGLIDYSFRLVQIKYDKWNGIHLEDNNQNVSIYYKYVNQSMWKCSVIYDFNSYKYCDLGRGMGVGCRRGIGEGPDQQRCLKNI